MPRIERSTMKSRGSLQEIFNQAPRAWAEAANRNRIRQGLSPIETRHSQANSEGTEEQVAQNLFTLLLRKTELLREEAASLR